jgi:hypothetical protein
VAGCFLRSERQCEVVEWVAVFGVMAAAVVGAIKITRWSNGAISGKTQTTRSPRPKGMVDCTGRGSRAEIFSLGQFGGLLLELVASSAAGDALFRDGVVHGFSDAGAEVGGQGDGGVIALYRVL